MSDTNYEVFQHYGTAAERGAFTPDPSPASGVQPIYLWYETDTSKTFLYDTSWHQIASASSGIPAVVQGDLLYGSAANTLSALAKDANATRYLSNTGATNNPAWAQVALATGVSGDLPFANIAQGSALSVLGVTGNATADNASIAAGSDHQVMRRSGTAVAFGAVNLAQSAAVTGVLPVANGGTGSATGAAILKVTLPLTNANIINFPTTAITVIAAPGANLRIHPLSGYMMIDTTNADYGNIHANCLFDVTIGGNEWFSYLLNGNGTGLTQVTDLLTPSTEAIWRWQPYVLGGGNFGTSFTDDWGLAAGLIDAQGNENQPLVVSCNNSAAGIFSGGNVLNTGRIVVLYLLEPTL